MININNRTWPKLIFTTYYFGHPVFIYSVVWSNVPASNFQKNQKFDPNSGNFLLVGFSPVDVRKESQVRLKQLNEQCSSWFNTVRTNSCVIVMIVKNEKNNNSKTPLDSIKNSCQLFGYFGGSISGSTLKLHRNWKEFQ